MDCTAYRRALLADPGRPTQEMRAHVAQCRNCPQYTDRILRFESRLERGLQVDIGEPGASGTGRRGAGRAPASAAVGLGRRRASRWRRPGLALAASLLLGLFGAGFLWLGAPGRSLAAAVVDHMSDEPDAWARTGTAVPKPELDAVMREAGAHLRSNAGLVSYVHSCEFRGHLVPHLVVQTPAGPVTVMVLVHESVRSGVHFDEQGYRGMIVPLPDHGSMAVLERTPNSDMKAVTTVAARVVDALEWTK